MSTPPARKRLPDRPSEENLKKQAKGRAKRQKLQLSAAQHGLAREYGFASWAKLIEHVRSVSGTSPKADPHPNPAAIEVILKAARDANAEELSHCLSDGIPVAVRDAKGAPLLVLVCRSKAPQEARVAAAKVLIDGGAPVRAFGEDGATALHFAAFHGPITMVELLIRSGALAWQADNQNREPLEYSRTGVAPDKDQIVELLDRPVIRDRAFKAAVRAIQTGDLPALHKLLAEHPNLVHDRAIEPDCYPQDYFRDPRLLWFVANNPGLNKTMPANTVEIARAIIDAGADEEDLQCTLGLVMTSAPARNQGFQRPLIQLLISRGARIKDDSFLSALGHREHDAVRAVLEMGVPVSVTVAAGLCRLEDLERLLKSATADEKHAALCVAVVNSEVEAARMCIEAGAEVNRTSVVHRHSMPVHQAVAHGSLAMVKLLVAHGARLDVVDTLWNGTPLGWAIHCGQPEIEAYLRSIVDGTTSPD